MADEKRRDDFKIEIGDRRGDAFDALPPRGVPQSPTASTGIFSAENQGVLSVLSYCASSILMTTANKYVLSGSDYNLNFLLLAVQVHTSLGTTGIFLINLEIVYCLRRCH
jgi:GDP-mannose transporter